MVNYNMIGDIKLEKQASIMENKIMRTFLECGLESRQSQSQFVQPFIHQMPRTPGSVIHTIKKEGMPIQNMFEVKQRASQKAYFDPKTNQNRRNGGRKPTKTLTAEEEEKRAVRREKNKLAAARCRKRRLDHTNQLLQETEHLQKAIDVEKTEICKLQKAKKEIHMLVSTHDPCFYGVHKTTEIEELPSGYYGSNIGETSRRCDVLEKNTRERPMSLPVVPYYQGVSEVMRIPPKQGPTHFNFESLMEGGTGLTPMSTPLAPSYVIPQRDFECIDLSSPSKLVSL